MGGWKGCWRGDNMSVLGTYPPIYHLLCQNLEIYIRYENRDMMYLTVLAMQEIRLLMNGSTEVWNVLSKEQVDKLMEHITKENEPQ